MVFLTTRISHFEVCLLCKHTGYGDTQCVWEKNVSFEHLGIVTSGEYVTHILENPGFLTVKSDFKHIFHICYQGGGRNNMPTISETHPSSSMGVYEHFDSADLRSQ